MGRPRAFDVETALSAALDVFLARGFENSSLTALTAAMGINRPSLYAAFGNKEALFRRALDQYERTAMAFLHEALAAETGRDAVGRLLHGFADLLTREGRPTGCLVTCAGATASADTSDPIRRALLAKRHAYETGLRDRLARAVTAGELAPDSDPTRLAALVMTIAHGMSVQATSGADRAALHAIVDTALAGLPDGQRRRRRHRVSAGAAPRHPGRAAAGAAPPAADRRTGF